MKKRLIAVLLATTMVFANAPGAVAASGDELVLGEFEEESSGEVFLEEETLEKSQEDIESVEVSEEVEETTEAEEEIEIDTDVPETEDDQETQETPDPEGAVSFYPEEEQRSSVVTGYRDLEHKVAIKSLEGEDLTGPSLMSPDEETESYYVTPNLPALRDQGNYGTCWAFSALALAEINMMNNGELPSYYSPEYSKLHLAYFSYRTVEDPLGGTAGDRNGCFENGTGLLDLGGNVFLAENVLANWTGAASEEVLPYEEAEDLNLRIIDEGLAFDDMAHLQGYYDQAYDISNLEPIKNLIKKCGAVSMAFYAVNPFAGGTESAVYNAKYNSYYNPSFNFANHAIAFVGWDDNFPKENFSEEAPGDGAWLVRNSWKKGEFKDNQEYDGYFWMSYYEASLYDYVHAFEFESADNYDNNYQYDGGMDVDIVNNRKAANIFTSKALNGAAGETLKAVGFYSGNANADYEVSVYTDLRNPDSDPESGTLASRTSGRITYAGFNTIVLDEPVDLPPDTVFSVVVELLDQPYAGQDEEDRKGAFGVEYEVLSWYTVDTHAEEGQSFFKADDYSYWEDYGKANNANIKIKAYTVDNEDNSEEAVAPADIVFDDGMDGLVLGISESKKIRAAVFPKNAANKRLEYKSSDTSVVSVVNGYIYGKSVGTARITARALMDDEFGNHAESSFTVTVEPRLLGLTIDGCEDVEMGKDYTFTLRPIPEEAELPEEPFWMTSDPKVVSIDPVTGSVKGNEVGSAMITAFCGDETESFYVWVFPQAPEDLRAEVDRSNIVTLRWDAGKGAQRYEIVRNGMVVKRINASSGKNAFSYVDPAFKGNFESEEVTYAVRSVRKDFWICDVVSVRTFERIELDAAGGSCSKSYALCLPDEEPGDLPVPVKKGYTFNEWEKVANNLLVARYTPNSYTVSFDPNAEDADGLMMDEDFVYDAEEELPENIYTRSESYDFAGWNTRADGSGKAYTNCASVKNLSAVQGDVVTLYAQWEEAKKTVTFDTAGGSYVSPKSVPMGEALDCPDITPVKSGSRFDGWFLDAAYKNPCEFPITVTEDITIYAKWAGVPKKIEITNHSAMEGEGNYLYLGTSPGKDGYSIDLSANILMTDGKYDEAGDILWTTSDVMVAGLVTEEGAKPVSRITTYGNMGNTVSVAIYTADTNKDGYPDLWPPEGCYTYIYATSVENSAVYGSIKVVIKNPDNPGYVEGSEVSELRIMHGDEMLSSSSESKDEMLSVASDKTVQISTICMPEKKPEDKIYFSSSNMAVATVSQDGVIKGKSAGTAVITAKHLLSGLHASFKIMVYDEITAIKLADSAIKAGQGKTFEVKVSAVIPATGSGEIEFFSSDDTVAKFIEAKTGNDGKIIGIFEAGQKGKAVISVTAADAISKCNVTVGNPVESIAVNVGKGVVAIDKTLKLKAVFNGGDKKNQPLNKTIKWSVTDLEGKPTDRAVIDRTGKLTALKPGCVRVRAESTVDGTINEDNNDNIVRIYVPVKKATLSATNISIKPKGEYEVYIDFTPASVEGYPCTAGFNTKGEAVSITEATGNILWTISDNNYASKEELQDGGCRVCAGAVDSKGKITLKASYLPYGAKKPKTLSCKVSVTSNAVSKIALSQPKVNIGRGTTAEISAKLTPTAPEESGVIWTIPNEYAGDICFMNGEEEIEDLVLSTSLDEGENTVMIKAKENSELKSKTVKLIAETVAKNKNGQPYSATCNVVIYGNANCIEFTGVSYEIEIGKSFTPKTIAYFVNGGEKTKADFQKFVFSSSDVSVASVNRTSGKVTANGSGTATITATLNDGSDLCAKFSVRVSEPLTYLSIDKAALYMGIKNVDAESKDAAVESAYASYNLLTPVVSPEGAFGDGVSFTWSISDSETLETAAVSASILQGTHNVAEVQKVIAGMDNGSLFAKNDEIVTTGGQALALKANATGKVKVTITASNGKKASCNVYISAHVTGINVITDFGATPDDGKSDNVAINNAIKTAHANYLAKSGYTTVFVPGGIYDVSAYNINSGSDMMETGIHVFAGVKLIMDPDAVLRVQGNNLGDYGVICVQGEKLDYGRGEVVPDNIEISGGQIYGERNRHTANYGESGHGIYLAGACNVTISEMMIYDNWGDGIYIGTRALFAESVGCRNITIKNCEIFENRRNGISVVDLGTDSKYTKGLVVDNCLIRDSHGTAPQCGIYVEPNNKPKQSGYVQSEFIVCDTMYVKNTDIRAYQGKNDAAFCCYMSHYDPNNSAYVTIRNVTFEKCNIKGWFGSYSDRNLKLIDTSISGTKILGPNL